MTVIIWKPGDRMVVSVPDSEYTGRAGTVLKHGGPDAELPVSVALDGEDPDDYAGFKPGELAFLASNQDIRQSLNWSVRYEDRGTQPALVTDHSPRQAGALAQDLESLLARHGRDGNFFAAPMRDEDYSIEKGERVERRALVHAGLHRRGEAWRDHRGRAPDRGPLGSTRSRTEGSRSPTTMMETPPVGCGRTHSTRCR